jgi:iron complex transport system permease protein
MIDVRSKKFITIALVIAPFIVFILSLFIGKFQASPSDVITVLASKIMPSLGQHISETLRTAILNVRLPRIILAFLVGASLSISGASYQGLFRNPLVSSHILGVASGASFGAALGIFMDMPMMIVQLLAFFFGLTAVGIAVTVSRFYKSSAALTLVLVGFITGSFFSSLVSFITYTADPNQKLPAIVFWLMGSLASSSIKDLTFAVIPMAAGIGILILIRWRINILSLGDEDAKAMGLDPGKWRITVIICCTLITSVSVCVSGVIGWIGLVIPHVGRMIVGPNHKALLPACISIGGIYLMLVDNLARTLTSAEVPLGILTGIIGAPIFAYLLTKGARW